MYQINKRGVIDWAYEADNPETMNTRDLKINTDSANYNYNPKMYPIKNPDEKTQTFYNSKLMTSLDELDKMLSTK